MGFRCTLALEGDFYFRPGLVVTSVAEVKGLEFDAVVVPDAGGAAFTSTPEARRALACVTFGCRANSNCLALVFATPPRPSPPGEGSPLSRGG
jgi:hypothetical protein